MNEQFKELAKQAGAEFYEGFLGSPDSVKFKEKDFEKFTKLIAQECANICATVADVEDKEPPNNRQTAMTCKLVINRRFGIEE